MTPISKHDASSCTDNESSPITDNESSPVMDDESINKKEKSSLHEECNNNNNNEKISIDTNDEADKIDKINIINEMNNKASLPNYHKSFKKSILLDEIDEKYNLEKLHNNFIDSKFNAMKLLMRDFHKYNETPSLDLYTRSQNNLHMNPIGNIPNNNNNNDNDDIINKGNAMVSLTKLSNFQIKLKSWRQKYTDTDNNSITSSMNNNNFFNHDSNSKKNYDIITTTDNKATLTDTDTTIITTSNINK
jgi:hypothetical protein